MGVERGSGGARGGRAIGQEPLDGEVVIRLEARGNVEGRNILGGKGNFDFGTGGRLEGGLGSH